MEVTETFVTDGVCTTYTFADLAAIEYSGVEGANGEYVVTADVTVAETDVIALGDAKKVVFNDAVTLSVDGLVDFVATEEVAFAAAEGATPKPIYFTGDVESGLIIDLYAVGEVVNPVIYDVFKRTHIKLMFTLIAGDHIIINTNAGAKSITLIRGGVTSNIMGYMYPDSTWLKLEAGDNVFTTDCERGADNLQLTFTASILYGGV